MRRGLSVCLVLLLGCGGTAPPAVEHGSDQAAETPEPTAETTSDARGLAEAATFADLVRAARTLDDRREAESTSGCLLARTGARLEADVAVAVRPLPNPWNDLDELLRGSTRRVEVLSRWGRTEADAYDLALVAFTATPPYAPTREALVVVLTGSGAYVRSTARASEPAARIPRPAAEVAAELAGRDVLLYVTAEATVPVTAITAFLGALGDRANVALASPLQPDAQLPVPLGQDTEAARLVCPDGLPELAESEVGVLETAQLLGALGPLRAAASSCIEQATTGASGGTVELALRIGPSGRVERACAVRDETGDAAVRACLLAAARDLAFPAPAPTGRVDVQLPLRLVPTASAVQRPLCP